MIVMYPLERKTVEDTAAEQVVAIAEVIASTYRNVDVQERTHPIRDVITQTAKAPLFSFVEILNHSGKITLSDDAKKIGELRVVHGAPQHIDVTERDIEVSYQVKSEPSCLACHRADEQPIGVIRIGVKRSRALSVLEKFHVFAAAGLLVGLLLLGIWVVWLSNRLVTRPVFALARLMQQAEKGDFLVRAKIQRQDEVGALSNAFNKMLASITDMKAAEIEREADLRHAREELGYRARLAQTAAQLQASNALLARRIHAQELLTGAAHEFSSTLDRAELLDRWVVLVREKFGWQDFSLFLAEPRPNGEPGLRIVRAEGAADRPEMRDQVLGIGEGLSGQTAESGLPQRKNELFPGDSGGQILPFDTGSYLSIPILHKGRVIGVMDFFSPEVQAFDDDAQALLQALGAQMAVALVNAELYEVTRELSVTDPLTQLMNRRAMQRRLEHEFIRAERFKSPLAVLMIDVDHFKLLNDRLGHLAGDEALRTVAQTLAQQVRKVDAVARYGGEEFCVILPQTGAEAAREVGEKLRVAIERLRLPGIEDQPLGCLSISVGLAVYPEHMPSTFSGPAVSVLVEQADRAALAAKQAGRNRVMCASALERAADSRAHSNSGKIARPES